MLIIATAMLSKAQQEFAPIGAEWYYNKQSQVPFDAHGYTKYVVQKDTTIKGIKYKKVLVDEVLYNGKQKSYEYRLIQIEGQKVYSFDRDTQTKQLVFDFSLNTGDTLKIDCEKGVNCDSITPIIIDSVSELKIGGKTLKVQHLSYKEKFNGKDEFNEKKYTITEQIGTNEMFVIPPACSYESSMVNISLRCYINNDLHYKSDWFKSKQQDCDILINETSVQEMQTNFNINVFPNPSNSDITFQFEYSQLSKLKIINQNGKLMQTFDIQEQSEFILPVNNYNSGIYFYQITNNKGQTEFGKFVVE